MMNPDSNNQNIPKGLDDLLGSIRSDSEILGEDYDQNIPKGLDDLLSSIRGKSEPDNSSALAVYVPDQREEDLVSEQIDERILTLLGLEDAIDIDYATYKTLLREKMMEGRMADSKMPTEETEILTEEFRRVKGNTGRFKVKREKINFESFVADVKPQEQSRPQSSLLALPGTAEPDIEVGQDPATGGIQKFLGGISDRLAEIEKNLSDMLDMDAKELADEKKDADKERVVGEKQKKRDKESKLESGIKGFGKKVTDQVTKPIKGLFDTILNFFTQIFLGNLVKKLIEFIDDPMLIFNPLIGMVNGVIDVINNVLEFMFGGLVENINKMIGPLNGGLTNLENTVNSIFGIFGEQNEEDKIKFPRIPEAEVFQFEPIKKFEPKEEKKEEPIKGMTGGGLVTNQKEESIKGMTGGGLVTNQYEVTNINAYTGGGSITGSSGQTITGMGPDTQLIATQPGEVVMSKKAVQSYGANNLLAMNKSAGGTNVPTMGTIQGFSGGGIVEPVPSGSYKGQSGQKYGDPRGYGPHAGIDITEDPPYGQDPKVPVVSMAGGKVVPSSPNYPYQTSGYTSNLTVNHGNGLMATYLHMKPDLKVGSSVEKGQKIGNLIPLGSASNSFAQTHLHLQTYKDGKVISPLNVLNGTVQPGNGTDRVEPSPSEGAPAFKMNKRGRRVAVVKPSSKSTPTISPPPQKGGQTSVLPVPGSNQQQPPTSSVSAGQKDVPSFSSRDMGNAEFIVIKSIYNIAG